jgi:uncharacterized protein YuzE
VCALACLPFQTTSEPELIFNAAGVIFQGRMNFLLSDHAKAELLRRGIPNKQGQQVLEKEMKVTYDPDVDVLRILFCDAPIEESDEDKPGVIIDYDGEGNIVGMEILNASLRVSNPHGVEYTVTA